MERLQKVLDTYVRYLNSLKKEETDIKANYSAMKVVIERDCEEWLKKHMLQDSIINSLRANRKKYDDIKPSSRIQLLLGSQIGRVKESIVIPKADGEKEIRYSWLPTLYQYFNPQDLDELESMEKELNQLHSINLVCDNDYLLLVQNIFNPRRYRFKQEEIQELHKEELEMALAE